MSSRRKTNQNPDLPATDSGPKPGDFPLGSARSRAAARSALDNYAAEQRKIEEGEFGKLTPFEAAVSEGCTGYKKRIAVGVAQMAQERAKVFGLSLPTPDEIRHGRALAKEIDRMTDGEGLSLSNSAPAEWVRLRAIAEENLRRNCR
jgi:hypothetical protein